MLAASDAGRHALLVADTGAGKTLAGFLPTLAAFCPSRGAPPGERLHTLYVSPLKALAHDVQRNLVAPVEEMYRTLNFKREPTFEAVATTGVGVFDTLKSVAKLILVELRKR